jgi:hypothetical protein
MEDVMQIIVAALLALGLFAAPAAAEDKKPTTATPPAGQAEKMKACNKEAAEKQLKGEERKEFMSACLRGSGPRAEKKS